MTIRVAGQSFEMPRPAIINSGDRNVWFWPLAAIPKRLLSRRCWGHSGNQNGGNLQGLLLNARVCAGASVFDWWVWPDGANWRGKDSAVLLWGAFSVS